jgi:hypothetical protein
MPAAVEMDCLIALSTTTTTTSSNLDDGCSVVITNLDPSWPGTTLYARRSESGSGSGLASWEVEGGSGKRGDWVAYLGSALDVSVPPYNWFSDCVCVFRAYESLKYFHVRHSAFSTNT